ncbi:uncharacterized protein [Watersipora subatra]|uniref:uncharacterized protein n=1 Tax=Watersipora subatra TaxID=2589382 RepID=UPI00355BE11C
MASSISTRLDSGESSEDETTRDYDLGDEDDEELVITCPPSQCPFCNLVHQSGEMVLKHVEEEHGLPLNELFRKPSYDFYSYVKLVNYLRKHKPAAEDLLSISSLMQLKSLDDSYMLPVEEDDGLLQFDFEMYQEKLRRLAPATPSDETITVPLQQYQTLIHQAQEVERMKANLDTLQAAYAADLDGLRSSARRFIDSVPCTPASGDQLAPELHSNLRNVSDVHRLTEEEDDSYIGSYSHYSIHLEMLQDTIRTGAYKKAICSNRDLFRGKVVLDVGCGTGILSLFAASAGATQVISVDMSDIVYQAMAIVRENDLEDKVTIIKGKMEEVNLPVAKVDIIISEWMGYFLLFESMLDSVIFARNKWLKEGGLVWPNECKIYLMATSDSALHCKHVSYWDDVYGFKMSCMKGQVCRDGLVQLVSPDHIVCQPFCVKTIDCNTCCVADLNFTTDFSLCLDRDCNVTALIGYFDSSFDSSQATSKVFFSTGPLSTPTHWKQTVFLLEKPLARLKGDELSGTITVNKLPNDPRSLQVEIILGKIRYTYVLS